jgi:purine-binding chemotaxis protein CheW
MKQLVVFSVQNEEFGVSIEDVNSIERMTDIFKIPNTPDYIEGMINLRGKIHTIINLRKRFHMLDKEFDEENRIIIVKASGSAIGIIVDSVREILNVEESNIEPAPKTMAQLEGRYISSMAKVGERIIMQLDLEKVLASDDATKAVNAWS